MCGIVGILSSSAAADRIVHALKRLEYRGYDSAGLATLESGRLVRERAAGKVANLETKLARRALTGASAIGHTRWATHGQANEVNAHPHATEKVAVVHNGIIENYRLLKAELEAQGVVFETETDTEVIVHLVTARLRGGLAPAEAVASVLPMLEGSFALAFLFDGESDLMVGASRGSPLAIGYGHGEMYVGSDAIALACLTDQACYLEDGDWAVITRDGARIWDKHGAPVTRLRITLCDAFRDVSPGRFDHFMAKEIREQPEAIARTIRSAASPVEGAGALGVDWKKVPRVTSIGCGTAFYAGLIGKYWLEALARLPCDVEIASEFRSRDPLLPEKGVALFISQSGETADTLASLRLARSKAQRLLSIVNVETSTIARESEAILHTQAGPEIGVASTKAFTCQLAVLFAIAMRAGARRGAISELEERRLLRELAGIPAKIAEVFQLEEKIADLCTHVAAAGNVIFLGRGTSHALALEGALKLKEVTYLHAEGHAAGELKHGPIALIDEKSIVIAIAPSDGVFDKLDSNLQEVAARGGKIILITDRRGALRTGIDPLATIVMPECDDTLTPLLYAVPLQMLAYRTAVLLGRDVDQPRNLAKSVTVE